MSLETARAHLARWGADERIMEFDVSSATVELAAQALGCDPRRIAKTLAFDMEGEAVLIVAAGDAKIDNPRYRERFGVKAKMLPPEEVLRKIGHGVGGVCPFGVPSYVKVYLDASLRRFETVYPACGSANSAIQLNLAELQAYAGEAEWVDVCKGWREKA